MADIRTADILNVQGCRCKGNLWGMPGQLADIAVQKRRLACCRLTQAEAISDAAYTPNDALHDSMNAIASMQTWP